MNLYNENEHCAATWLENLSAANLIVPGRVDRRSIRDLRPEDLANTVQAHFFAGIGVWSYALRQAGWSDDLHVWTGSCPCQPFSAAGKKKGFVDDRHLWPVWFRLIEECRPPIIFGEQVSSPDGLKWFDVVSADLEGAGYAVGALDTCAAGVGAPHVRQRLYWMAISGGERCENLRLHLRQRTSRSCVLEAPGGSQTGGYEHSPGGPAFPFGVSAQQKWAYFRDGKWRPVEPEVELLVDGDPGGLAQLRALGNALCAPQAIAFVQAAIQTLVETHS